MRRNFMYLIAMILTVMAPVSLFSQKNQNSINQITSSDIESYVTFLASPLLKGRMNGEEGLEIAAQYIASQAKLTGLKPANGTSYFQPYAVMKKTMDPNKTKVQIISNGKDTITVKEPMYQLVPTGPSDFTLDGEVVKVLNNVAGYIEGSDSVLKNEIVVFSSHYDHIGASGSKVNTGADDDASGCAALLSMAEAFQSLEKKPLRSILFLWVSGEEIGLYGSKSYVDNPLFPLEKTVADLNMDMIGRVKGVADSTKENPMSGTNTVFVITDNQSKDLWSIADEIDKKSPLDFDYSLSGRDHPLQLFARSDHYNFVEKDIPVLFFTTGLHTDYHTPGDVVEKIDFKKMEMVTRTMFEIGLTVANRKTRLIVDNPFSSWGKSK
ncbi:MAG: M28 family peptidase [Bacteroidales bacterium]|nr:M28 family peptidase [Bacteroidales bacterium]